MLIKEIRLEKGSVLPVDWGEKYQKDFKTPGR